MTGPTQRMDQMEKIEDYVKSWEEYFLASLSAVTTDLPSVHEAVNRLWVDISRYGPGMPTFPEVRIPVLGDFQVPPPPPPPPTSSFWMEATTWAGKHPFKATGLAVGVIGVGLLAGYSVTGGKRIRGERMKTQSTRTLERRQVIVVLGGDTPLALPLISELEQKGYIIVASVSTPEAADFLEKQCNGFVRALVLDPFEPATIPVFFRSLSSTLSRRFPITASGDPYASPASMPYIHSIISLLTLPSSVHTQHAPFEHISLSDSQRSNSYLSYLNATQITPLEVIQRLLPLLRTEPARTQDKGDRSIIVCLPAMDVRVGLPFASLQAMSAAGTLRAMEVLRREIKVAGLTGKSEFMKNIRVVVIDVGNISQNAVLASSSSAVSSEQQIFKAMEDWSPSEKVVYGPAFASISQPARSRWEAFKALFNRQHYRFGIPRGPTDVASFINCVLNVVSNGRHGSTVVGLGIVQRWIRGERLSVGAGAYTYRAASYLPSLLLDTLLNIPHILIGIRNALLPTQPYVRPAPSVPAAQSTRSSALVPRPRPPLVQNADTESGPTSPQDEEQSSSSETSSEADTHSNPWDSPPSGTGSVAGSWVDVDHEA